MSRRARDRMAMLNVLLQDLTPDTFAQRECVG
jgi:hypothetical protein